MPDQFSRSVWSFDGPLRPTSYLIRFREPSGLSQYPVFKVQSNEKTLFVLRFFSSSPPDPIRRQMDTLRIVLDTVNTQFKEFFPFHQKNPEFIKNAPRKSPGSAHDSKAVANAARIKTWRYLIDIRSMSSEPDSLGRSGQNRLPPPWRLCKNLSEKYAAPLPDIRAPLAITSALAACDPHKLAFTYLDYAVFNCAAFDVVRRR